MGNANRYKFLGFSVLFVMLLSVPAIAQIDPTGNGKTGFTRTSLNASRVRKLAITLDCRSMTRLV